MSKTPRTDAARGFCDLDTAVAAEHMEEIEIENAELRAALQEIGTTAHCISKSGPATTPTLADAWTKFDLISVIATAALSK